MRHYFCGWYFKCQSNTQTLALIPAYHASKKTKSCSLQIITEKNAYNLPYPYDRFHKPKKDFYIEIGESRFSRDGIELSVNTADCSATGSVRFSALTPIRYDIMGPFKYVPFMECRHSVLSMVHTINGELRINGVNYAFRDGVGYIEGDRGYSFPKEYAWTQCCFDGGSLMLSVADIPLGLFRFTGVIGVVMWQGKEYRLATYLGAKAVTIANGTIVVHQGKMTLTANLLEKQPCPLFAPVSGSMSRTIHESATCLAFYRFEVDQHTLFSLETPSASFEYEYLQ